MSDVIKLQVPKDSLSFEIGDKTYTVSFADKSFAVFSDEYKVIKMSEVKLEQKLKQKSVELTDKKAHLEDELINETQSELNHQTQILERRYLKMFDAIQEKFSDEANQRFYKLLDGMFGKGSGKEIYETCNKSMIVFSKVVAQIMVNVEQSTDISDYREKYLAQIKQLRAAETDGQQ